MLSLNIRVLIVCSSFICLIDFAIAIGDCDNREDSVECVSSMLNRHDIQNLSFACGLQGNATFESIALCSSTNNSELVIPRHFQETRCFCDSDCHVYNDCCLDKTVVGVKSDVNKWSCREVNPIIAPRPINVIQKCPTSENNPTLRSLCEVEATSLKREGKYYDHLQLVPVHSMESNLIYRNVYCAMCNHDSHNLSKWKTFINCSGQKDYLNPHMDDSLISFSKNATYDPGKNRWSVFYQNRQIYCRLVVSEFIYLQWDVLAHMYGARLCKPAISTCLPNTDPSIQHDCQAYTSYAYKVKPSAKVDVYKNLHCALCNNVSDAICYDSSVSRFYTVEPPSDKAWLPLLFDFNFIGDDDNSVGFTITCRLTDGQIWDPLLRLCLNITCGSLFREEDEKCVPIETARNVTDSVIESSCRKIILTSDLFTVKENGHVYVNRSRKSYFIGQFEVYKIVDGTMNEILICEDDEVQFEFPSNQVWLSEFTLSLSIICLFLHILVYSLLPTLRNRPGKILMSLSASLICGHLFFLLGSYFRKTFWLCYIDAILTFYGYLSSFFWMSVMAFDIYRTFSSNRTKTCSSNNRTFVKYSLYSWLSPLCIVVLSLVTEHIPSAGTTRPNFSVGVCWFNSKRGLLIFFTLPLAILLLCNFYLFLTTAITIRKVAQQTKLVSNFSEKKRYFLYVKLAIVLGLTWFFGFLASLTKVDALWYPFIILNGLQGALIFIVFTMKRKVLHMLIVKLKIRSHKYTMDKKTGTYYRSLSNLTTLQTSLTSTVAPAASGSPDMLIAVRQLSTSTRT